MTEIEKVVPHPDEQMEGGGDASQDNTVA